MKTQAHRTDQRQQRRFEADLEATIKTLFRRLPTLCGFSVRDAAALPRDRLAQSPASGLFVTEVSVYPMRDLNAPPELCNEIVTALDELIDENPVAGELLRERTFARDFH